MDGLLLTGVIVLNIVGIIWLGRLINHAILVPIGYLILICILFSNSHDEIVGGVFIGVAVVTVSVIIGKAISAMRDTREEKENARLEAKKEAEKSRRNDDLLNAVNRGDKSKVQELLKTDVDVDYMGYISPRYKTLLEIALENNDKEMVILLIEKGANVNLDNDGKCPLDYANNEEIIALLRSHGAKTKEEIEEEKRAEEERKRLEAEESRKKYELQRMLNEDLCTAAQKLDMARAQYCILHGADVNYGTWSPTSFSPLMYAVSNGMRGIEMVKFLLQNGADPYKKYHQLGGGEINAIGFAKYVVKDESLVYFLEHYC